MSNYFVVRNPHHDVKHYATVGAQTVLGYVIFILCLFSVPTLQYIIEQVAEARKVERAVIGETEITLEIADDPAERTRGLGGRASIPKNHAMLFIFDTTDYHGIWMQEMEFPLDIIWLNEYTEVIHIERNVSPNTYPKTFRPQRPARYVLEFNAGFAQQNHLKIGDRFVLP